MSDENAAAAASPEPTTTTESTDAAVEQTQNTAPAEPVEATPSEPAVVPENDDVPVDDSAEPKNASVDNPEEQASE